MAQRLSKFHTRSITVNVPRGTLQDETIIPNYF